MTKLYLPAAQSLQVDFGTLLVAFSGCVEWAKFGVAASSRAVAEDSRRCQLFRDQHVIPLLHLAIQTSLAEHRDSQTSAAWGIIACLA
ncbi:hypothetical protein Cob_v003135 [Colletotrichum orbiculare MAFF 240422]|uniref:Uncharacterized protein n=1 Tax=Colletotrichum orbiculare (strain 104-T / ATCC 96160 / CBS 514.97 / LARS 414 / MAFF 240422) TaxID=1213857 RepID=A0A484G0E5_COLOR|nr:hypothetical protein Cob_v003135 [Colletotrichum orbiculare MAFF 240422]